MRFVKTVDVWTLSPVERAALQPGQHVTAGPAGPRGRFMGEGRGSTVVAWRGNAKGHKAGALDYQRALRVYARSVGAR